VVQALPSQEKSSPIGSNFAMFPTCLKSPPRPADL